MTAISLPIEGLRFMATQTKQVQKPKGAKTQSKSTLAQYIGNVLNDNNKRMYILGGAAALAVASVGTIGYQIATQEEVVIEESELPGVNTRLTELTEEQQKYLDEQSALQAAQQSNESGSSVMSYNVDGNDLLSTKRAAEGQDDPVVVRFKEQVEQDPRSFSQTTNDKGEELIVNNNTGAIYNKTQNRMEETSFAESVNTQRKREQEEHQATLQRFDEEKAAKQGESLPALQQLNSNSGNPLQGTLEHRTQVDQKAVENYNSSAPSFAKVDAAQLQSLKERAYLAQEQKRQAQEAKAQERQARLESGTVSVTGSSSSYNPANYKSYSTATYNSSYDPNAGGGYNNGGYNGGTGGNGGNGDYGTAGVGYDQNNGQFAPTNQYGLPNPYGLYNQQLMALQQDQQARQAYQQQLIQNRQEVTNQRTQIARQNVMGAIAKTQSSGAGFTHSEYQLQMKQPRLPQVGRTSVSNLQEANRNAALGVNENLHSQRRLPANAGTTVTGSTTPAHLLPKGTIRRGTTWRVAIIKDTDTSQGDTVVRGRIVDGPMAGSVVLGNVEFNRPSTNIQVTFTTLIPADPKRRTLDISAKALSLSSKNFHSTGVATSVNQHYVRNYFGALLESTLQGYGEAYAQNKGERREERPDGTVVVSSDGKVTKQEIQGAVAKSLSDRLLSDVQRIGNRPPTFKIAMGTVVDMELNSDLVLE